MGVCKSHIRALSKCMSWRLVFPCSVFCLRAMTWGTIAQHSALIRHTCRGRPIHDLGILPHKDRFYKWEHLMTIPLYCAYVPSAERLLGRNAVLNFGGSGRRKSLLKNAFGSFRPCHLACFREVYLTREYSVLRFPSRCIHFQWLA